MRSDSRDTKYVINTTKPYLNLDGTVDKYTMRAISVNDTRKSNRITYMQKNVKLNETNPFNLISKNYYIMQVIECSIKGANIRTLFVN